MSEDRNDHGLKAHKMPENSLFYDRILPIIFVVLGVILVGLIVFALGVLTGVVHWS